MNGLVVSRAGDVQQQLLGDRVGRRDVIGNDSAIEGMGETHPARPNPNPSTATVFLIVSIVQSPTDSL